MAAPLPPRPDIRRRPDWQPRLVAYLNAVARRPFDPRGHHCAGFVGGAIRAMTGTDVARHLGIRARTLSGGLGALRRRGLDGPEDLAAWAFAEIPPAFAGPGDVVAVAGVEGAAPGRLALGLCQGARVYVVTDTGLGLVPIRDAERGARRAFRVP